MTDHRVHLGAVAFRRIVPPDADHAVAMREPHGVRARIARGGKAVEKSHFRCVDIAVRQGLETPVGIRVGGELRGHRGHSGRNGAMMVRIVPLHDIVVLHAHDREPVEIVRPRERLDIRDMLRRDARGELDHDASARESHVQRVVRIGQAPVLRRRTRQVAPARSPASRPRSTGHIRERSRGPRERSRARRRPRRYFWSFWCLLEG